MKTEHISGSYQKLLEKDIIIFYKGKFDHPIINTLLRSTKLQLENYKASLLIKKRIYSIMVECLENICRYVPDISSEEYNLHDHSPIMMLGKSKGAYFIATGNLINDNKIEALQQQLEDVKKLDRTQLLDKYKDVIKNGLLTEKGGAGLGIIDMALRSDNRLQYEFYTLNNRISYFIIELTIKKEKV